MDKKILFARMFRNPFFIIGFLVVSLVTVLCFASPLFIQHDPIANNLAHKFTPPDWFANGLSGNIFGTDTMGRDLFTRLLIGGRFSLTLGFTVVAIQTVIGTLLGIFAGYFGGWIDSIIMRLCEVFLAVPNLILAIAILAVLGPSPVNLILVLSFSGWTQFCRVTANSVRVVKNQEFVHASQVLGAGHFHIMFRQIFPNVTTNVIILASQRIGVVIILEAGLSFLNVGIQPPAPSWGNMIAAGRTYMILYPQLVFVPGIALMLTVLAFNFLGDGLRDILDPKRIG
jgi:peptide/nickel transport system permease protein